LQYRHALDEASVRTGRKAPDSLHAIPKTTLRSARVEFPAAAFSSRRKSW